MKVAGFFKNYREIICFGNKICYLCIVVNQIEFYEKSVQNSGDHSDFRIERLV